MGKWWCISSAPHYIAFCYLLMEPLSLSPVSVEVLILSDLTHFQALLRICQHLKMKIPVTRLFLGALVLSQRLVLFCRGGISFSIVFLPLPTPPLLPSRPLLLLSCLGSTPFCRFIHLSGQAIIITGTFTIDCLKHV